MYEPEFLDPGIDSKESIPPVYLSSGRYDTLFLVGSYPIDGFKIPAQHSLI